MLRKTRLFLAILFFVCITWLFLDFTGTAHAWLGWMAKIQFLPAVLALNAGVIAFLLLLTLIFGRVYCSVICPLGVFQDVAGWLGKRKKKNRYSYSPARHALRYGVLALFVAAALAGIGSFVALLAPYSSYGRIASNFFAPLYRWGNNALAFAAERFGSYAFYSTEVWMKGLPTFIIAGITLVALIVLAWKNGRTYCNTVCPVGTVLGQVARFSWLKPVIDPTKCIQCALCARNCKAACIDIKGYHIDYSRCVSCMDCIGKCRKDAIHYTHPAPSASRGAAPAPEGPAAQAGKAQAAPGGNGRRRFLASSLMAASALALKAQEKKVDGGLAVIENKVAPARTRHILPPGALSARHFAQHCTACQLCVSACPNGVLRPSTDLARFMQPESSYERGYCRPECTRCSEVCPTEAIRPITQADKSATQIGHAVWVKANCIPLTDGVQCGNCARHCPTGAIQMIPSAPANPDAPRIPAVNTERCIGCGACENLCPARPFSAIYVEGNEMHRSI